MLRQRTLKIARPDGWHRSSQRRQGRIGASPGRGRCRHRVPADRYGPVGADRRLAASRWRHPHGLRRSRARACVSRRSSIDVGLRRAGRGQLLWDVDAPRSRSWMAVRRASCSCSWSAGLCRNRTRPALRACFVGGSRCAKARGATRAGRDWSRISIQAALLDRFDIPRSIPPRRMSRSTSRAICYVTAVRAARTFGFVNEAEALRAAGLGAGRKFRERDR